MFFLEAAGVVLLILFHADDLSGARLARRLVGSVGKGFAAGSLVAIDDAVHSLHRHLPVAVILDHQSLVGRLAEGLLMAVAFTHRLEQMGNHVVTMLGQDAVGAGQLNGGRGPVTLTDPHRDGIAHVPSLFTAQSFPVAGGHDPHGLFVDIQP